MHFTSTLVTSILAFTTLASARPSFHERRAKDDDQKTKDIREKVMDLLVAPT